jgi:hypothetical protein
MFRSFASEDYTRDLNRYAPYHRFKSCAWVGDESGPSLKLSEQNRWGLLKQANLVGLARITDRNRPDGLHAVRPARADVPGSSIVAVPPRPPCRFRSQRDDGGTLPFCREGIIGAVAGRQVLLLGIPPRPLSVWQTALLVSMLFHHSNLRLPIGLSAFRSG